MFDFFKKDFKKNKNTLEHLCSLLPTEIQCETDLTKLLAFKAEMSGLLRRAEGLSFIRCLHKLPSNLRTELKIKLLNSTADLCKYEESNVILVTRELARIKSRLSNETLQKILIFLDKRESEITILLNLSYYLTELLEEGGA